MQVQFTVYNHQDFDKKYSVFAESKWHAIEIVFSQILHFRVDRKYLDAIQMPKMRQYKKKYRPRFKRSLSVIRPLTDKQLSIW